MSLCGSQEIRHPGCDCRALLRSLLLQCRATLAAMYPIGIWGINIYLEHPGTCGCSCSGFYLNQPKTRFFPVILIVSDLPRYFVS